MTTPAIQPVLTRHALRLVLLSLACLWAWSLALDAACGLALDMGPGARDYVQGLSESWQFDGQRFWRRLETRARVSLPVRLEGPGTLAVTVRSQGPTPAEIRAELDDGSLGTLSLAPDSAPIELRWEIPEGRRRASVRLRSETGPGSRVEISRLGFEVAKVAPSRNVVLFFVSLLVLTYLALALAGLSSRATLCGTLGVALVMMTLSFENGFAGLHLATRLAPAALVGAVALVLVRLLAPRSSASLRALFLIAVLFKSALLFHPRFYFVDFPIHETLLELVYHRGMIDFWQRLPEYQKIHNLGVAPVGGEYRAFPYSVAFYFLAGLGNRLHHAPELWLKLTASLLAALALFPLGSLARRFSPRPRAELFSGIAYLLVPSLTRSLLLLELSAVGGCFFDLLAIACLARLSLKLSSLTRFALATAAMTAALAVYTASFIHFGLFVASVLALGLVGRGLDRRDLARVAAAGLLSAALALVTYHPDTVRALAGMMTGVGAPSGVESLSQGVVSVSSRILGFLGIPLLLIGGFGIAVALPKLDRPPTKLLFESWAVSALAALGLRWVFPDLFHFAKELYWGGALLALGAGSALATQESGVRYRQAFVVLLLVALLVGYAVSFPAMVAQFYTDYLFL